MISSDSVIVYCTSWDYLAEKVLNVFIVLGFNILYYFNLTLFDI